MRVPWAVLGVVALGGAAGAVGRYGLSVGMPHRPGTFPWATFVTNVTGCLLIGVLMVLITEVWAAHRLLRPFLGTGVLGGYTTFSTYVVDVQRAAGAGAPWVALAYLSLTLITALPAVWCGTAVTRAAVGRRRRAEAL